MPDDFFGPRQRRQYRRIVAANRGFDAFVDGVLYGDCPHRKRQYRAAWYEGYDDARVIHNRREMERRTHA